MRRNMNLLVDVTGRRTDGGHICVPDSSIWGVWRRSRPQEMTSSYVGQIRVRDL